MSKVSNLDSKVSVLKSQAAAKKGLAVPASETETVWPVPQFGPTMTIDNVTDASGADGFMIPAGSMFPLGCALPNNTVLKYGMYFPPGTMVGSHIYEKPLIFEFPDGVLVPVHARMVSVQPIQTFKIGPGPPEPACSIM